MTVETYFMFVLPGMILALSMTMVGIMQFQLWLRRRRKRYLKKQNMDGDGI
jgi:predicted Na+-dependent transporter